MCCRSRRDDGTIPELPHPDPRAERIAVEQVPNPNWPHRALCGTVTHERRLVHGCGAGSNRRLRVQDQDLPGRILTLSYMKGALHDAAERLPDGLRNGAVRHPSVAESPSPPPVSATQRSLSGEIQQGRAPVPGRLHRSLRDPSLQGNRELTGLCGCVRGRGRQHGPQVCEEAPARGHSGRRL